MRVLLLLVASSKERQTKRKKEEGKVPVSLLAVAVAVLGCNFVLGRPRECRRMSRDVYST